MILSLPFFTISSLFIHYLFYCLPHLMILFLTLIISLLCIHSLLPLPTPHSLCTLPLYFTFYRYRRVVKDNEVKAKRGIMRGVIESGRVDSE